MIHEVKS